MWRTISSTKSRIRSSVALAAVLVLILVPALSSCQRQKTFIDGTGRPVALKGIPRRIVSLNPAHTETLFALGLGDKVVGVDNYSYWPVEAQKKEKVGDAFNLNIEKLVGLKPDLVVLAGSKDRPPSQLNEMERLGIPAYVGGPSTVKEVLVEIETLSKVVGAEKQGKDLVAGIQRDLDAVAQAVPQGSSYRPTVFYAVDADLWTIGPGSFVNDIVFTAGGLNVVQDAKQQYLQVSMEEILAKDPDVILVAIPRDQAAALTSRPGWSNLRAVKAGKVFFVNADLTSRPGPAVAAGVKEVARCLAGK